MPQRTPEEKIGRLVLLYVQETVEALSDDNFRRALSFYPGRKGERRLLISKVSRAELVDHMRRYHGGNLKYATEQINRALSHYVHFPPVTRK